jgi:hypothetical protein
MNARQVAFYRQARSDWFVFRHFHPDGPRWWTTMRGAWCGVVGVRPLSFAPCHELHYLQMCTEKLAKAYFPAALPRDNHAAFRTFLRDLPSNPGAAIPLGFQDLAGLTRWEGTARMLVGAIEDLAPSIADRKGLPNPEYPWPRGAETYAPADYPFQAEVYTLLDAQAQSGEPPFLTVLGRMVDTMQSAKWHL